MNAAAAPAWTPPTWLSTEDRLLYVELVEAQRAIRQEIRDRIDQAAAGEHVTAFRWRLRAARDEAVDLVARLKATSPRDR